MIDPAGRIVLTLANWTLTGFSRFLLLGSTIRILIRPKCHASS